MARKKPSEGKSREPASAHTSAPGTPGEAVKPKRSKPRQGKKPGRRVPPQIIVSDEPNITLPLLSVEPEAQTPVIEVTLPSEISAQPPGYEPLEEETVSFEAFEPEESETHEASEHGPGVDMLSFDLGDVRYAFRLEEVEEIVRSRSITRVPGVMPFVLGITSIRGRIVPVVDIARIFRDAEAHSAEGSGNGSGHVSGKIIVLRNVRGSVGVLVGKRMNMISVAEGVFSQPPSHMPEDARQLLEGVALYQSRFVSIIDAGHLLGIPAIRGLHEREA